MLIQSICSQHCIINDRILVLAYINHPEFPILSSKPISAELLTPEAVVAV